MQALGANERKALCLDCPLTDPTCLLPDLKRPLVDLRHRLSDLGYFPSGLILSISRARRRVC